ncbi:MAG: hypothetical protein ABSG86_00850 [Thermoguttaceae bacterium]|jgi:preprotein translocase subunit SecD
MNDKDTEIVIPFLVALVIAVAAISARGEPPAAGPSGPQIGTTLIYEIDKAAIEKDAAIGTKVVDVLNRRANPGWWPAARVRRLNDGRIEVGVYGNDAEKAKTIERIADRTGTLEFRIVATRHDDLPLIERGLAEPKSRALKGPDGLLQAKWVRVDSKEEKAFTGNRELATRAVKSGGLEVLVKVGPYDVGGEDLRRVAAGVDDATTTPCVNIQFSSRGAELFGRLTTENLPTEGFHRQLGIILDGVVHSAPRINSAVYERAMITGNFTPQEVDDIVAVLNAGSLPARIKLVEKRQSKDAGPAKGPADKQPPPKSE